MRKGLFGLAVIISIIASGIGSDHIAKGAGISAAIKANVPIIERNRTHSRIVAHEIIAGNNHHIQALIYDGLDPT
jgi:hypothetical protein